MADIFERAQTQLAGVFTADVGKLSFGGGVSTALVQNVNATYAQTINRLYEVGNIGERSNVYLVGGRTQGNMTISRVIGPATLMGVYYRKFGNVCNARTNTLQFTLDQTDCSNPLAGVVGGLAGALGAAAAAGDNAAINQILAAAGIARVTYQARYCVITQLGISVAAQDMIVNEQSQVMFSGMDYAGA